MSTHPWVPPLPLTSLSLDGVASFNGDVDLPGDYNYNPNFPVLSTIMVNYQPLDQQRSVPESTFSFSDTQYPQQEYQAHRGSDAAIRASSHVSHIQAFDNLNLWNSPSTQMISDVVSPTDVDERHSTHTTSSRYAYDLGRNGTHWNYHTAFNSCFPNSYPPLLRPVGQDTRGIGAQFHGHLNAFPHLPCSLNEVPVRYPVCSGNQTLPEPFPPRHVPLPHPFSPSSSHLVTRQDSRSYSHIYPSHPPRQGSTESARRRRPVRAIEYDGLWIDEAELKQGLMEPSGNISVHQCRWEEDRSPCGLWVKGNKSCINLHIQKWHRGKPGGDKLKADCRWSGCGMAMQRQSIGRHVVTIHLGEVWECQGCGKEIARNDAYGQHAARSNLEDCRTSGALITYAAGARVVNARAALDGGGRMRYAGA